MKTLTAEAEELRKKIKAVETNFSLDGGYSFEHTNSQDVDKYAEIAIEFATQQMNVAVAKRDEEIREFTDSIKWILRRVNKPDEPVEIVRLLKLFEINHDQFLSTPTVEPTEPIIDAEK